MIQKLSFLCFMFLITGCDQDPGYVQKTNLKIEDYAVKKNITPSQFQKLKNRVKKEKGLGKNTRITVVGADNLKDENFKDLSATMLVIAHMPQLTDKAIKNISVKYLLVENIPSITSQAISKLKGLKTLELWNMPHITEDMQTKLLKKGIKVYDGRNETGIKFHPVD